MSARGAGHCRQILAALAVLLAARGSAGLAAEAGASGRITYEIPDGVYVNLGSDNGLSAELTGSLQLDDGRTFGFEVLHATRQSALLRLAGARDPQPLVGRRVELVFESKPPATDRTAEDAPGPTEDFVPLLAPAERASEVSTPRNLSHGRIQVRQMFQTDSQTDLDYAVTRVGSSGSIERIDGSPWSFEWAGDMRYRDGDAYRRHPDYQEPHLDLYRALFHTPLDGDGFFQFGRFLPAQLPGIGYVDGLHGEVLRGRKLRLGVVGGLKPGRLDLEPSADEPLVAGYATLEAGQRSGTYYSGTFGLLSSYFDGAADRLALLFDQRANLGPDFTVYSTAAVDFDTGAAETRNGTRLTRLDVTAISKLSSFLTLRGGVDHWERPDHQAERDLLVIEDDRFFDDGYWRYWVGSNQNLPWRLGLYEEIAFIDSDAADDSTLWRVRMTRTGLFAWRDASASVTFYNLATNDDDGYGLRASGYLPFGQGRLVVQPAAGFRMLETDPQGEDISLTYLSLHLDGRLSREWTLFGGAVYSEGDEVSATLFELGLRYSW